VGSLDETEFWARLEYRICDELSGFEDKRLRCYWCDGLIPEEYDLLGEEKCIRGLAWIGDGRRVEQWNFALLTASDVMAEEEVDWAALLPEDTLTGWLTPDPQRKTLKIDPLSGYRV
jgi:hypothetical protein